MSESGRRSPAIAMGLAIVAVAVATVAVVTVVRRGSTPQGPRLEDHRVQASDVVKLEHGTVEPIVEGGEARGVRVTDAALAKALGLAAGDRITAVSGRMVTRESEIHRALFETGMLGATTLYVELVRDGEPVLARWRLDGDLRASRRTPGGGLGTAFSPDPVPDPSDPLASGIERIDDTHSRISRAALDQVLSDPSSFTRRVRVVPAIKDGQPVGFKVYAIRPSSAIARLGFQNGDTIRAINGYEMTGPDKALEVYTKVRSASELTFDLERRGQPLMLSITIR